MKRLPFLVKAAGATALVLILGAGAALVALKTLYPEPRLRAWAVDAARKQLGREVKLDHVALGLRGVTLDGLQISERPDFAAGTFLSVERFRLRPSWTALLRRKLVVAAVAAEGLKVRVVKEADGRFNYESLASTAAAPAPASAPAPSASGAPAEPPALDVRGASVSHGFVEYVDRAAGFSWTVSDLDLSVSDFGLARPFSVKTSARVRGKSGERPVDARVGFDGTVDLARGDRAAFKTDVRKLTLEAEGLKLTASGKAAGLDAPKVDFDATLAASGHTVLTAQGKASLGETVEVDAKAKTPGLDTTLLAKFAPGQVPALDLPPADLTISAKYGKGQADVKTFVAEWKGGRVDASGTARGLDGAKPDYSGRARFGVDVPEIRPGQYPFLKLPPRLFVPAGRLDGDVSASGEDLTVAALSAKTKAGTIEASGTVRRFSSAKAVPQLTVKLALDLPSSKVSDLPVSISSIPPSTRIPAMRVDGTIRLSGDDVRLDGVVIKGAAGSLKLDGTVAKALAGTPEPAVDAVADLDLPALTDADLPFPGVPAGLRLPASRWTADVSYSPRLVRVKSLRLKTGHNDLDVSGSITDPAGRGAFDLLLKCPSYALDEISAMTPQLRELKLAGTGRFAISVTGRKEKPLFAGKLLVKDAGATVADLPLSGFSGTFSFDDRRMDAPDIAGKVAGGNLKMDVTVKDYSTAPEVQLEAEIDSFDLGRWLAANNKVAAERKTAKAAQAVRTGVPEAKPLPIATRGHLSVGSLVHPEATVQDVKLAWNLRGLTPDLRGLDGDAQLHVGGGRIRSAQDLAKQSNFVKVLLFPVSIVQKLGSLAIPGFPDSRNTILNQIVGDYVFRDGLMTLRQSEMDSAAAQMSATGTIDLPVEKLDLVVTADVKGLPQTDLLVTGTFDQPKIKVNVAKLLKDNAKAIQEGASKIFDLLQKK